MLNEERDWVVEVARQIAKEEIALATAPKAKVVKPEIKPEPAPVIVEAEAPVKKGK